LTQGQLQTCMSAVFRVHLGLFRFSLTFSGNILTRPKTSWKKLLSASKHMN